MSTITKHYRQTPYGDRYTIEYRPLSDGTYDIVATECPPDSYGKGSEEHHRYQSGRICIREGYEPRTLDKAQATAAAWIDGYSEYIRTGTFPKKARAYNV
jgi:hypothetical protein